MEGALSERLFYKTEWIIRRYLNEEMYERGIPTEVPDTNGPIGAMLPAESVIKGNKLLNSGIAAIQDLICGIAAPTKWDAGNARIGVGDNATAANETQTGLLAAVGNQAYNTCTATFPSRNNTTLTWQAAFTGAVANYSWQEFTVTNAGNNTGNSINRVANNQGTKINGQVWTVSVQLTLS
jgi:hypothetical protein